MEKKRKIIPPVYLMMTLALMWLMNRYLPVYHTVQPPAAYSGIIPVLFGISMAAISVGMFRKAGTGIEPFDEATTLVTAGFYRFTRNPMYLGMFLMLLGVAFCWVASARCSPCQCSCLSSATTSYWVKNVFWSWLLATTTWPINLK